MCHSYNMVAMKLKQQVSSGGSQVEGTKKTLARIIGNRKENVAD